MTDGRLGAPPLKRGGVRLNEGEEGEEGRKDGAVRELRTGALASLLTSPSFYFHKQVRIP